MDYIVYQQRPGGTPARVSNHTTQSEAVEAAENLLRQWEEVGVNPPSVFVCYNGTRSVEVWRDGKSNRLAA